MSSHDQHAARDRAPGPGPGPGQPSIPELEVDQTDAPRPEEEIADVLRAEPDVEDHAGRSA